VHKSIRFKLFLTFLLTTSLVVSGMYLFMRWSLDRGFNDFIETRQQERIGALIEGLSEYYAGDQGWHALTGQTSGRLRCPNPMPTGASSRWS
jgi:two-component system sensor histidine kinase BaeS